MSNNNIEEDIKQVENFLDDFKNEKGEFEEWHRYTTIAELQSISNVVNELKEANNQLDLDYIKNNYIHKDAIKEKLKELKKQYKEALEKNSTKAFILKCKIEGLEELLKE